MQRRGQAFETMMLVISVIVALAILAVLLNVLGIVKIFNPSNPSDIMNRGLKDVQSKGFGITAPQKIAFTKGASIFTKELLNDIPIQTQEVQFFCDANICSGTTTAPLKIQSSAGSTNNKLMVSSTVNSIEVYVVVCGNEANLSPKPKYCISIARDPEKATSGCEASSACDLA